MWTLCLKTPPTLNIWTPSLKHWRGLSCHKSSEEGGIWTARKPRSLYTTLCSCIFLYLRTCVFVARKIPPLWHTAVSSRLPGSVVNDEAKLWNPIYSPLLSHSTSETSSLLLWTRILLRLKWLLLTHFQQSSSVDFQLKKYQPLKIKVSKIWYSDNFLYFAYLAIYKLIHSLHCSSVAHLEKVVTTSIWKIMYCNKGWQFTSKPYCKEQSHLHKNQGYSQCTI